MLTSKLYQSGSTTIRPEDLKNNAFNATLNIKPELWSACVDESGKLPPVGIRTTISLNATKKGDSYSGGSLGGSKTELKKALLAYFTPAWKPC